MSKETEIAILHTCLLAVETVHPRFARLVPGGSTVLTVNNGWE